MIHDDLLGFGLIVLVFAFLSDLLQWATWPWSPWDHMRGVALSKRRAVFFKPPQQSRIIISRHQQGYVRVSVVGLTSLSSQLPAQIALADNLSAGALWSTALTWTCSSESWQSPSSFLPRLSAVGEGEEGMTREWNYRRRVGFYPAKPLS